MRLATMLGKKGIYRGRETLVRPRGIYKGPSSCSHASLGCLDHANPRFVASQEKV
jgi:hypothetical protein